MLLSSFFQWLLLFCPFLRPFAPDDSRQPDVFRLDGDSACMNGTEICVFKQTHQARLRRLLQCQNPASLVPEVTSEIMRNFTHQTLEGSLPNQQFACLLVAPDLTQGNCSGAVAALFLHPSSSRSRFASRFGGGLHPRGFPSSRPASCLLCSSHDKKQNVQMAPMSKRSSEFIGSAQLWDSVLFFRPNFFTNIFGGPIAVVGKWLSCVGRARPNCFRFRFDNFVRQLCRSGIKCAGTATTSS